MKSLLVSLLLACVSVFSFAADKATPPVVTGDARVDKLLSEMTLQEKLTLIHGTQEDPKVYQGQAGYLEGVPRLGIPGLRFADGPPGVLTRVPSEAESATMAVAATFSVKDALDNGVVVGREDRANGIDVSLQPFVNIDRDLEFGRGYNTFGEDPYLTSMMGVGEIQGIQSQHVMAQVKHYVAYDSNSGNIFMDDQTLHEVYVAPFDAAVKAGVSSIMCSYNRVNGTFACGNKDTLTTILRNQIGVQRLRHLRLGRGSRSELHQCRPRYGNAGRTIQNSAILGFRHSSISGPLPPPPPRNAIGDIMAMFGGHIPEEPAPARFSDGRLRQKAQPGTNARGSEGWHRKRSNYHPRCGPRSLRDRALRLHGRPTATQRHSATY